MISISCDMCGRKMSVPDTSQNGGKWRYMVTVRRTYDYSGMSARPEFESVGMDLCPNCVARATRIELVNTTQERYINDRVGSYREIVGQEYRWIKEEQNDGE